jgi:hypothetical protein
MQYRFILKRSTGEIVWQPGPDRTFKTWESNSSIVIAEDWENAGAQKVIEDQVINTPDLEPVVAVNVSHRGEEVTPDFNKDIMLSGLLNPITDCAEQNVKKDKSCGRLNFIDCITLEFLFNRKTIKSADHIIKF